MSRQPAVRVEHVFKQYRLHGPTTRYSTLRDALTNAVRRRRRAHGKETQRFWALDDISFDVQPGETVGIIGHNGAGKSTLLKVLSRITEPTKGFAELRGRVGSLLEVGTGFHLELTGRENIYLSGAILGMKRAEIRACFDDIVAFAEVEKFVDTPVKHYSSGMHLRLAFAVAAHLQPEILLVDEVLAVGDARFQRKCLGKMGDVAAAGRTVVFVSHNLGAVKELCRTGIVLSHGRQVFYGSAVEAVSEYSRSTFDTELEQTDTVGLRGLELASCDRAEEWSVRPDEPISLRATLELRDTLAGGRLYCIINDSSGGLVVHHRADLSELSSQALGPSTSVAQVDFPPLWLGPGIYSVHMKLMARTRDGRDIKYVSEHRTMDVTGWAQDRGRAYLAPTAEWSLASREQSDPATLIAHPASSHASVPPALYSAGR